jgi:hypothetical protein
MTASKRHGERAFLDRLYAILRDYQDGKLKDNGTIVGQLDQPLTEVADLIQAEIRQRVRSWRKDSR